MTEISDHRKSGKFSPIVNELFTSYIRRQYPKLVDFVQLLLEHMEENAGGELNSLNDLRDIGLVRDRFLNILQREVGTTLPQSFSVDPRLFYRNLTQFYRSRGTPQSIKLFFRYLFNDSVEISFPKDDLLIPSDGRYTSNRSSVESDPDAHDHAFMFSVDVPAARRKTATVDGAVPVGTTRITIDSLPDADNIRGDHWHVAGGDVPVSDFWYLPDADDPIRLTEIRAFLTDPGNRPITDPAGNTLDSMLSPGIYLGAGVKTAIADNAEISLSTGRIEISGQDDGGQVLGDIDLPIVTRQRDASEELLDGSQWIHSTTPRYSLKFNSPLLDGDVVRIYPSGLFTTNDGFLSDRRRIQDSLYYQLFSYVIRTGVDIAEWRSAFTQLIHPSGFAFFGEIQFSSEVSAGIPLLQVGRQEGIKSPLIMDPRDNPGLSLFRRKLWSRPVDNGIWVSEPAGYLTDPLHSPLMDPAGNTLDSLIGRTVSDIDVDWISRVRTAMGRVTERNKFRFGNTPVGALADYSIQDLIDGNINITYSSEITLTQAAVTDQFLTDSAANEITDGMGNTLDSLG